MDVVILAGARCDSDLRKATNCEFRAELPFRGRRMLDVVAEVLAPFADHARVIVGGVASGFESLPPKPDFLSALQAGLSKCFSEHAIIATSDIPFITTESVTDFISRCDTNVAINWPIVNIQACASKFPNMRRTTLKLREGRFTGGNLVLINRPRFESVLPTVQHAYANRKKPLRLAKTIGLPTLVRVLFGQLLPATLPLKKLVESVGKFLGQPVNAVISHYPELAADVDSLEQYNQALRLAERQA